jgi:hypothetical protein
VPACSQGAWLKSFGIYAPAPPQDIALKLQDKANKALMTTYQHLQRTMDCIEQTVVLLDTSVRGWQVVYVNAAWTKHTGEGGAAP